MNVWAWLDDFTSIDLFLRILSNKPPLEFYSASAPLVTHYKNLRYIQTLIFDKRETNKVFHTAKYVKLEFKIKWKESTSIINHFFLSF